MNREEIAKKIESILRNHKTAKHDFLHNTISVDESEYIIADFVLSEIAAAEKRARVEVAEYIKCTVLQPHPFNTTISDIISVVMSTCNSVITANTDVSPVGSSEQERSE